MHVLIADKLADFVSDDLQAAGFTVDVQPQLSADELPAAAANANVLVVRSTKVTAETIHAARPLSLIIRAGAGVNTIDLAAASERGVYVANCPGTNTLAVAELAIGLMIAADRQIAPATLDLRAGQWNKKKYSAARGLAGRTLGIVGFGSIGQAVARRAQALEMPVIAWSRSLTDEQARAASVERVTSLDDLAALADVVSIHLAMNDDTRGLIGEKFFSAMNNEAIFVNTSRGEVVDTAALQSAIENKQLRVALDVFENEPTSGEAAFDQTELAGLVTATPHIGASTSQAAEAVAREVVRIATEFHNSGKPPGAVNLCDKSPATTNLVVRHYNRVGVLAGILDGLREEGVNIEEMENVIFQGSKTACCTLSLDRTPSSELLTTLGADANIINIACESG